MMRRKGELFAGCLLIKSGPVSEGVKVLGDEPFADFLNVSVFDYVLYMDFHARKL